MKILLLNISKTINLLKIFCYYVFVYEILIIDKSDCKQLWVYINYCVSFNTSKAAEFERLLQTKSSAGSNMTVTSKIVICLDLAANMLGAEFDGVSIDKQIILFTLLHFLPSLVVSFAISWMDNASLLFDYPLDFFVVNGIFLHHSHGTKY